MRAWRRRPARRWRRPSATQAAWRAASSPCWPVIAKGRRRSWALPRHRRDRPDLADQLAQDHLAEILVVARGDDEGAGAADHLLVEIGGERRLLVLDRDRVDGDATLHRLVARGARVTAAVADAVAGDVDHPAGAVERRGIEQRQREVDRGADRRLAADHQPRPDIELCGEGFDVGRVAQHRPAEVDALLIGPGPFEHGHGDPAARAGADRREEIGMAEGGRVALKLDVVLVDADAGGGIDRQHQQNVDRLGALRRAPRQQQAQDQQKDPGEGRGGAMEAAHAVVLPVPVRSDIPLNCGQFRAAAVDMPRPAMAECRDHAGSRFTPGNDA